jgi:hypothetical protein
MLFFTECKSGVFFAAAVLELVQDSLAESKTSHFSPFFTFFQLRSSGYEPSKMQKLTKNQPVFANGRES